MSSVWVWLPLHSAHCCSCNTPALAHLNNCQLCVTLNFHLRSFGSSCLTGSGGSADQTMLHTCSAKCAVIRGKRALVFTAASHLSPSLPCVRRAGRSREASCLPGHMLSPHFITLLPPWASVPVAVGGVGKAFKLKTSSGSEPRHEFSPSPCCLQPYPKSPTASSSSSSYSLYKQSEKCLGSNTEQSVLC